MFPYPSDMGNLKVTNALEFDVVEIHAEFERSAFAVSRERESGREGERERAGDGMINRGRDRYRDN